MITVGSLRDSMRWVLSRNRTIFLVRSVGPSWKAVVMQVWFKRPAVRVAINDEFALADLQSLSQHLWRLAFVRVRSMVAMISRD